ncbi:hypothetical protein [Nocardia arthritidis]|uniref:Uncharacterized protein n=1 Tax=Nocardia arthritidis TaxID=228602 RepID=A0A6G9YEL1_9NOCA|nr:hypothetical protein [Nocardia arthritidis]QIS11628.1 hypothetical protein F5544_18785 [Nocardia arthritidis]
MSEAVGTASAPAAIGRSAEFWGYVMWGLAGIAIAIPEFAAIFRVGPWPTISATIGHLADQHDWVRLIVVFVIVVVAYYAVGQLRGDPEVPRIVAGKQLTANGRVTTDLAAVRYVNMEVYLLLAAASYIVGMAFAITDRRMNPDSYLGAYVLYGLIALMWVIVPSVLALFRREVPFPTLFRTIGYLERRAHPVAAVLLALLVILLLHLAFYPWPGVLN